MCIATGKTFACMKYCFDYCFSQSLPQSESKFEFWRKSTCDFNSSHFFCCKGVKTEKTLISEATTGTTKTCSVHFLYHRMIYTSNTVASYIRYQSHTGQLWSFLFWKSQHNYWKSFLGLCRFGFKAGCLFSSLPVKKSFDFFAQTYTQCIGAQNYTHKQRHKSLLPHSLPSSPTALDQASFSTSTEHRGMTVVPWTLFSFCLSQFKPQNTIEEAASVFEKTLLGVHLLTC